MSFLLWIGVVILFWVIIPSMRESAARESAEKRREMTLRCIVGMMAKLAKADGRVTEDEVDVARSFIRGFVANEGEYRMCVSHFNTCVKDTSRDIHYYARWFGVNASAESRQIVYELLWSIAAADGTLDDHEAHILRDLTLALRIPQVLYGYCFRRFVGAAGGAYGSSGRDYRSAAGEQSPSELERAYARLGCSPEDSDDKIRTAYRKQAMKFHPDRLRSEGLPEALLKKANESMAEINHAWDVIKAARKL